MNNDSREMNSTRNLIVGASNQIIILILNLVSKSVFIKMLGPVFMGLNGLFTNIFLLLSFAEFGIGSVMIYSLYKPINRRSEGEVTSVYHYFRKIYLALSVVIAVIGLGIIPLLPTIVNTEVAIDQLAVTYLLYLLGITITNTYIYKANMIIADQKAYIISLYLLFFEVISMLTQILVLFKTQSYLYYLVVFILKNVLYGLALNRKVKNLYPFLSQRKDYPPVDSAEKKIIFEKIRDVFGYKFARVFITGTDNILISMIVGTIWVGYYSNYDLIIVGVLSLVTVFYDAISASVGSLIVREDIEHQYAIFEIVQHLNMWIAGFTTTALFILFQDFITLWLGGQYTIDFKIVLLIIINYYLVANRKAISIFREASGMFNKIKYAVFIGAFLNILFSVSLGYLLGIYGILLGTILSTLMTYYWYEAKILLGDKFSTSLFPFIKNQTENLMYTIISILLTTLAVSPIKNITIGSFILKMGITVIVSNLFYLFLLSRKKGMKDVISNGLHNMFSIFSGVKPWKKYQ